MPEIMRNLLWSQSINHQAFFLPLRKTFTDEQFEPFLILNDIGEVVVKLLSPHTGAIARKII